MNGIINDSLFSIIITIIGLPSSIYGIFEAIHKAVIFYKKKKVRKTIWKNNNGWVLVLPKYDGHFRSIEDIIASETIKHTCEKLNIPYKIQNDTEKIPENMNVILICGPKANKISKQICERYSLPLSIIMQGNRPSIYDSRLNAHYYSPKEKKEEKDIALVAKHTDPNTDQKYLFCWGLSGIGTIGAAKAVFDYTFAKNIKNSEDFEAVISVPYKDDYNSVGKPYFLLPPRSTSMTKKVKEDKLC